MANTYKSALVSSGQVRGNWRGADFTIYASIAATEAAAGDIFQMVQVPNGYSIESVTLDCDKLDSNAAPAIVLEVGDSTTANRFINASTVAQAGGVQRSNVAGATGYSYTVGTNPGQFSGGNAGATVVQVKVATAAATFQAGTIRLAVRVFLDSGAFA